MAVISEKHYPHPTFEEEMREIEKYQKELKKDPDYKPEPIKPFEEFYKDIVENRTLIIMPERIKQAEDFIRLAIITSEEYELDTIIRKNDSHISVDYSFDSAGEMMFLLPILREADNISFFTGIRGYEITMSIDFYTHAEYLHGRLLHPIDLEL